jgi:hypothetical protein
VKLGNQSTVARLTRVRDHVSETFARVLERDPSVRVTRDKGTLYIRFREKLYTLTVSVTATTMHLWVTKQEDPDVGAGSIPEAFFDYTSSIARMGRLRKTALVLFKKMQHAEVFEVMEA